MRAEDILVKVGPRGLTVSVADSVPSRDLLKQLEASLRQTVAGGAIPDPRVSLDLGERELQAVSLPALAGLLAGCGLQLNRFSIRPAAPAMSGIDRSSAVRRVQPRSSRRSEVEQFTAGMTATELPDAATKLPSAAAEASPPAKPAEEAPAVVSQEGKIEGNALYVQKNLRSGQSIRFPGNVIIKGDVNPGAEVVAGGNIVVLGSLRGVAHAGAEGDEKATITAFYLRPTQLRIAGQIARPPDGDDGGRGIPELARMRNGKLIIERIK